MCGGGFSADEVEAQEKIKGTPWYIRTVALIVLLLISIVLGMVGTVWIGVRYKGLITDNNASCALKASLFSFVVEIVLHTVLVILEIMYICWLTQKRGCCNCEFVTIKTFCHLAAVLLEMMGITIFAIKDPEKVGTAFYFLVSNLLVSVLVATTYIGVNAIERCLLNKGLDIERLKRGSRLD